MIFSAQNWNGGKEIRQFIPVAYNLEYDSFESPIRGAWDSFIVYVLGTKLSESLIAIYKKTDTTPEEKQFLYLAQKSNVFLALWYGFDEINTYISDDGLFRSDGSDKKTLYKYQEQSLRENFKNKGFNAIDELLSYLESKSDTFSDFRTCPANTLQKSAIVSKTSEVDDFYFINHSRLIFLRLLPHFRTVERTIISPRLGSIYDELISNLSGSTPDEKFIKLRNALIPVVVNYGVSRLIKETGSITDKGLYFDTLSAANDIVSSSPVSDDRMMMQSKMAEGDAIGYWRLVDVVLKSEFNYNSSNSKPYMNRDNNGKKSFFA